MAKHATAWLTARSIVATNLLCHARCQEVTAKRKYQASGLEVNRGKGANAGQGFPHVKGIGLRNRIKLHVLKVGVALAKTLNGGLKRGAEHARGQ